MDSLKNRNTQLNQSPAKADQVIVLLVEYFERLYSDTWRTPETEALPIWSTNGSSTQIDSPNHVLGA